MLALKKANSSDGNNSPHTSHRPAFFFGGGGGGRGGERFMLNIPVNSYVMVMIGMVSSPNHTFSTASLTKQLTSTSCTYFRL